MVWGHLGVVWLGFVCRADVWRWSYWAHRDGAWTMTWLGMKWMKMMFPKVGQEGLGKAKAREKRLKSDLLLGVPLRDCVHPWGYWSPISSTKEKSKELQFPYVNRTPQCKQRTKPSSSNHMASRSCYHLPLQPLAGEQLCGLCCQVLCSHHWPRDQSYRDQSFRIMTYAPWGSRW